MPGTDSRAFQIPTPNYLCGLGGETNPLSEHEVNQKFRFNNKKDREGAFTPNL